MSIEGYQITPKGILPFGDPASSLDELTRSVSDGFYTTFATLSGGTRVLGLTSHLERLYGPARKLRLHPAVDEKTLRHHLARLAKSNLPAEARIRVILTKDTGDVYVGIQPFHPLPASVYEQGVSVVTAEMSRHDPRIKGTDFIAQSAEHRRQVKGDVFEILLVHKGGILEGMTSNFYAIRSVIASERWSSRANVLPARIETKRAKQSPIRVRLLRSSAPRNDILITAQKGILLGVTRRAVLRLARGEGISIEYRPPRMDEYFDEAFITSSSRGIVPVVSIDGQPVGQGSPGAWTKRLSLAYQAYVRERSEDIVKK
jgi:branched-subunit amino acid aminotransferase/4-amino-4-deoxychorismate lyase